MKIYIKKNAILKKIRILKVMKFILIAMIMNINFQSRRNNYLKNI